MPASWSCFSPVSVGKTGRPTTSWWQTEDSSSYGGARKESLEAVRLEFSNFVSLLGGPTPPDRFGLNEIDQALRHAGQLIDSAPEAPLCQYLAGASRDLVRETHIAWIESHLADGQSPSPAQVYAWYWNETLGEVALDGAKVEEAAATASALVKSMGLDEVVDYLRHPDKIVFYGMMNILPATPIRWSGGLRGHQHGYRAAPFLLDSAADWGPLAGARRN